MADIRINSLPTTASASSSDDFLALDGATNGTRKLNAYSPTFGGNLTVSGGTATLGSDASLVRQGNGWVQIANTSGSFAFGGYSVTTNRTDNYVGLRSINNTGGTSFGEFGVGSTATGDGLQNYGYIFTGAGLNGIRLFTNGSTTAKLTIDNAGLTTLAGNLTVSGTGTSSFASNINVNKSTAVVDIGDGTTGPNFRLVSSVTSDANAYLQIGKSSADTNANLIISRYSTGSTAINSASIYATTTLLSGNLTVSGTQIQMGGVNPFIQGTTGAGYIQFQNAGDVVVASNTGKLVLIANGSTRATVATTGNLLLATTTDSGNGKLQLADHSTSAGGIGFGTDVSLFRGGVGQLVLSHASVPIFSLYEGSTNTGEFYSSSGNVVLGSKVASTSLTFRTVNTTALTLDSSQRCILAGALRLNNAYTAGAPTATGYVTLQDSAGNTYKVLVGT